MKWIPIDINSLPEGRILAANFTPYTYGYTEKVIGYLGLNSDQILCCESEFEILENPTQYIDIDKFDILAKGAIDKTDFN